MKWVNCPRCGERVLIVAGRWACYACGKQGVMYQKDRDRMDPTLIHDAILPEALGNHESAP